MLPAGFRQAVGRLAAAIALALPGGRLFRPIAAPILDLLAYAIPERSYRRQRFASGGSGSQGELRVGGALCPLSPPTSTLCFV
jgi:hypothetical protein